MALICVTGDRNWTDEELVFRQLVDLPLGSVVGHGDQGDKEGKKGLDRMAGRIATELGLVPDAFPADWDGRGLAAGPERNVRMLNARPWQRVVGFHDDIQSSKGTKHCLRTAKAMGIPTSLITHTGTIDDIPDELLADDRYSPDGTPKKATTPRRKTATKKAEQG
jgi:hypothetical protein